MERASCFWRTLFLPWKGSQPCDKWPTTSRGHTWPHHKGPYLRALSFACRDVTVRNDLLSLARLLLGELRGGLGLSLLLAQSGQSQSGHNQGALLRLARFSGVCCVCGLLGFITDSRTIWDSETVGFGNYLHRFGKCLNRDSEAIPPTQKVNLLIQETTSIH